MLKMIPRKATRFAKYSNAHYSTANGVPVINCKSYSNNEQLSNRQFQKDITNALISTGCFYITNHSFDANPLYKSSNAFFRLNSTQKDRIHARHKNHLPHSFVPRGYLEVGAENLNEERPCVKESYDMGNIKSNQWPLESEIPGFQKNVETSFDNLRALNTKLLQALSVGLGLEPTTITSMMDKAYCTMRFLHYVERDLRNDEIKLVDSNGDIVRGGEHTDTFINTLIISKEPGLRIRKNDDNKWYKVPVVDDGKAILFFAADMFEVLTNGLVKAGVHQVIVDGSLLKGRRCSARQSIALFNYANFGLPIKPLQQFVNNSKTSQYEQTTQEAHSQYAYQTKFNLNYVENP